MTKFLRGTIILLLAGFITRVLGFINRIVIARFIGEEGVGLYMMVFPTLMLVISITQLGLPVAISKSVAEAEAAGDKNKTKRILIVSLFLTLSLSLILTPLLMFSAKILSTTLFTDERTFLPLLAIAPIIPIVAVSSVIRGYFQGKQNMKPAAIAMVIEQVVRIGFIILLTNLFIPYGIEYAAAAAMVASVIGELASFLYLIKSFNFKIIGKLPKKTTSFFKSSRETFEDLMSVALPTMGSRIIGSIAWFFEPIVVTHSLAIAGLTAAAATKQYGALTGFALPLLMLPSFITFSLSTALVPAISEAYANKRLDIIQYRLQQALNFVLFTGGIALIILYVQAEGILQLMYGSTSGLIFIKLMAPLFLFSYFQAPLQATLQALNLARSAMFNSLIGAIIKLIVIFLLASQPQFGINGAAIGIMANIVIVSLLHMTTIAKRISFSIYIFYYLKAGLVMIITSFIGFFIKNITVNVLSNLGQLFVTSIVMSIVYLLLFFALKLITLEELNKIPMLNSIIQKLTKEK